MTKGKLLAVCCVWLVILGIVALTWKMLIQPAREKAAKEDEQRKRQEQLKKTSGESPYDHHIHFALDSFSGYAVFRSQEFRSELANKRIDLSLVDDKAEYLQRIRSLQKGDVQLAVFTVDALIRASADLGDLPATIVAVVDETKGADAMVAYAKAFPDVNALNNPDTKFVLTPHSPSETLARVVMAHFNLQNLDNQPFVFAEDADDVYQKYVDSKPDTHQVFVLWEPYVSKVLENRNMHVVIDSADFLGYIVDVIVAGRDFLDKKPDVVADFVEAYLRAVYAHRERMVQLVLEDAAQLKAPLTQEQADNLAKGVLWKNTQENYAHFGFRQGKTLQHIDDIIQNITDVLSRTGAISSDPAGGKPEQLYYNATLAALQKRDFHPGLENVRDPGELPPLADAQWGQLVEVGAFKVQPLVFARSMATLTSQARAVLDDLTGKLGTWRFYVLVRGNALRDEDPEINKVNEALAQDRAKAVEEYLIQQGISSNRVKAIGVEPSGSTSVSLVLGQPPY